MHLDNTEKDICQNAPSTIISVVLSHRHITARESLTVVLLASEVIARPAFYVHFKSPPYTAGDAPNHRPVMEQAQATPTFVSLDPHS